MKKGIFVVLAAFIMQACLGSKYAWSAYVPALKAVYGLSAIQTNVIFGLMIACFVSTMVIAGKIQQIYSPRAVALVGSFFYGLGYMVASASHGQMGLLLLGISFFLPIGIGLGYVPALSVAVRWFPNQRGLVTGFVVAGYGGGSIVISKVVQLLLVRGWDVLEIFGSAGLVMSVLIFACALLLKEPPVQASVKEENREFVHVKAHMFPLLIGMFAGTFGGLVVIGNLMPLALSMGLSSEKAIATIGFFAVGNMAGRIVWGYIQDRVRWKAIPLSLGALCLSVSMLLFSHNYLTFSLVAFAIGFNYGASFVVHAAYLAAEFGTVALSRLYPYVLLAFGVAGITGPFLGGLCYDLLGSYESAILLSVCIGAFGMAASSVLLRRVQSGRLATHAA